MNSPFIKKIYALTALFLLTTLVYGFQPEPKYSVRGELKKWHKVELVFDGPNTDETADINPFLDYRLDVTFTNNGKPL